MEASVAQWWERVPKNSSDVECCGGSCQIKGLNTSINKLYNAWSLRMQSSSELHQLRLLACEAHPTQWNDAKRPLRNTQLWPTVSLKMWFKEKHIPTFLHTHNQEHVNINTAINSSLEPTFPPSPHVPSIQHTETRVWGEGLVDKLAEASRGFLISGRGQVGIGRWTAYATAPTDRETNPHFISHICSTEPQ